jgi:hypothetical protein
LKSWSISTRLFRLKLLGRLFLSANANRQSLPASGSPPGENPPTAFGGHTSAKPVIVEFLAIRRLKSSFHASFSLFKLAQEYKKFLYLVKTIVPLSGPFS